MLTVRLGRELEKRLGGLAERTGHSKSFYVRKALEQNIENFEDYYMAAEAWTEYKNSGQVSYTLDEVSKHLGLDDTDYSQS